MKIELSVVVLVCAAGLMLSLLLVKSEIGFLSAIAALFILQFFLINDDLLPQTDKAVKK